MLYVPEEVRRNLAEVMKNADGGDAIETARRALAILPGYSPAYLLLGSSLFAAGKLDEAKGALWEGISHDPIRPLLYLNLAEVRTRREQVNVLSKRIRHLALWKISFMHKVPDFLAELFKPVFGDEAYEPETYERLAMYEDIEVEKANDPPEIVERLRPYRLFNDLQREAPDDLSEETLQGIIAHAAECEPLLRNALRQWALSSNILHDITVSMLIAILGEISGPEALDELLELAAIGNPVIFPHVHWAILNLGMRFPGEAFERFRIAAREADVKLRCALANHVDLLDEVEGEVELLVSLLDGFENLPREEDGAYLLAQVVYALVDRGDDALAKSLAEQHESKIPEKHRHLVREALDPEGDFMPVLLGLDIDGPDIEGVCLGRHFLSEEGEEEDEKEDFEDDEFDDDEFDDPVDLEPLPPKPGRNEPCWCGSGKKYKKCHLAADEEAERRQAAGGD
jgi:hypothetical protein